MFKVFSGILILLLSIQAFAVPKNGRHFDRAIFVIFENADYAAAIQQPFFKKLGDSGALFTNFLALTHPSQGNYIALTSGSLNGVTGDANYDLNVHNIVDLLEAKGVSWKVYAENYPGNCFTGKTSGNYARKHNPFISYVNIQKNQARCGKIVDATEFDQDMANGTVPEYVFYIPNMKNDGHDTGVTFGDAWYSGKFTKIINDAQFMANTILISTFDESSLFAPQNLIYTSIVGPNVKPQVVSGKLSILSLMNLMEDNWTLGNLGLGDSTATPIPNIWKQ